jgi:hypothetical protein
MSEATDETPAFACCSAGIGRWFWVAWASESEARAFLPALASGYEPTAAAAERRARESAGPRTRRLPAKWASGYRRGGSVAARAGRPGKDAAGSGAGTEAETGPRARKIRPVGGFARQKRVGATRPAFLYSAFEGDPPDSPGQVVVVRHRIVKQNARKIHVDREPFREEDHDRRDDRADEPPADAPRTRTLAVDRETLRREGRFRPRHSPRDAFFYASEDDALRDVEAALTSRHAWCATLGVRFPCSADSIKAAYRRLARSAHPDAGGDPSVFRAVEQAYRDALAYFAQVDGGATPPDPD